ncbi:MAG: hypothetical protein IJB79_07915 [Candidatus Gastranaerophilales bacterium]|nr:hypothetical protein [Candidatus Gastranaerophilales bacterium]
MNTLKAKINKYLNKNCIFIFAVITFLIMLNRVPFWDESHAFSIARLDLKEIFYLTRIEGHTFLWYLLIKPFSSLNLYPWSMWIINWLFCLGAIFVLWKKAPFSPIAKALMTFSTPFLYYFAPVARCYSIGIFLLFLICALYKYRFKKPFLFSSLIIICANTSILAAFGVFYIGLIYVYDLILKIKKKTFSLKKFYSVIAIFLTGSLVMILQFIGARKPIIDDRQAVWDVLSRASVLPWAENIFPFVLHLICSIGFYYFAFLTYKNSKRAFFFISGVYLSLTYLFLMIYQGSHWNYYFYYIYFIVLFWLFKKQILKNKFSKILFITILFLFIFPKAVLESGKMDLIYASKSKLIAKEISQNKTLKNSKLYTLEWWSDLSPGAIVYLEKEKIYIYDWHNRKTTSFESIKDIFKMEKELIDFDDFYQNMDKNGYLLSMGIMFEQNFVNMLVMPQQNGDYIFKTDKKSYLLKMIIKPEKTDLAVFKISEI